MMDPYIYKYLLIESTEQKHWYGENFPATIGLDSFYKVSYRGPRIGFRLGGSSKEKYFSKMSLSYAMINTDAYGWWNIRDFSFWHQGEEGYAVNMSLDLCYFPKPNWFIGIGWEYMHYDQNKLEASYNIAGFWAHDIDYIRNADNVIYGPSFKLGFIW